MGRLWISPIQFGLCQDPLVKGTTKIMNGSNPAVKLLLGSGKLLFSIIILNVVLECVFYELNYIGVVSNTTSQ